MPRRSLYCLAFCLWLSPWLSQAQTARYDLAFKRWGEFYAPWQDWHWWRAQGIAESGLDQAARSRCAAIGVMQLLAETAKGLGVNPYDAESNIQGGIKYDASLARMWARASSTDERRDLAFASYNAGPGNVARAVKLAAGIPQWTTARVFLPQITGVHAGETVAYVAKIRKLMGVGP